MLYVVCRTRTRKEVVRCVAIPELVELRSMLSVLVALVVTPPDELPEMGRTASKYSTMNDA